MEVSLRRSALAYVYRENPALKRPDCLAFYDRVLGGGVKLTSFSFDGPELVLLRQPAPSQSAFEVRVGAFGVGPKLRLLIAQFPSEEAVHITEENANVVAGAFSQVWGSRLAQPELTEVTLDLTAPAPEGVSAKDFLAQRVAGVDTSAMLKLGREFEGFGLRLMSSPAIHLGEGAPPPLSGASVEARIETLSADPTGRNLFFQVQAKWPALAFPREKLPPEVHSILKDSILQVNEKAAEPTFYLKQVYEFASERLVRFLTQATR